MAFPFSHIFAIIILIKFASASSYKVTYAGAVLIEKEDSSCVFGHNYHDFEIFGCPANPKEDDCPGKGYWSPCKSTTCSLRYKAKHYFFPYQQQFEAKIRYYLSGEATIILKVHSSKTRDDCSDCETVAVLTPQGKGWIEETVTFTINKKLIQFVSD